MPEVRQLCNNGTKENGRKGTVGDKKQSMVTTTCTATMLAAWVGVGACFFTGTATAQSCTFHGAPCPPNDELAFACASGDTAQEPWCDTGATLPRRVASLVAAMTLPEKIAQLSTYSFAKNTHAVNHRHTPSIPRLGLPGYNYHSEGLHGDRVRRHSAFVPLPHHARGC